MCEVNNNLGTLKSRIIELIAVSKGEISQNAKSIQEWFSSGEYLKELQKYKETQETEEKMNMIVEKLREMVPWEAVLPTEKITNPISGPNSDCTSENTFHLDGFLYDDTEVYKMLEDQDIKQRFCSDCGSHNVEDVNIISHSLSRQKLQYVFKVLLPKDCATFKVLDVGSRLGAVLYGAYFYTNAAKIFGVELNQELCDIQNRIISMHDMETRIKVINGDISEQEDIVATCDIIILNNVFEFFMNREAQIKIWRFLKTTLKKGCIVITVPSLEESLDDLDIYEEFSNWIEKIPAFQENNVHFDQETMLSFHDIYLYTVK